MTFLLAMFIGITLTFVYMTMRGVNLVHVDGEPYISLIDMFLIVAMLLSLTMTSYGIISLIVLKRIL